MKQKKLALDENKILRMMITKDKKFLGTYKKNDKHVDVGDLLKEM